MAPPNSVQHVTYEHFPEKIMTPKIESEMVLSIVI